MIKFRNSKEFFDKNAMIEKKSLPIIVDASMSINYAINVMKENNISAIGVTSLGKFIGILTEKDLLNSIIYNDSRMHNMIVAQIMHR